MSIVDAIRLDLRPPPPRDDAKTATIVVQAGGKTTITASSMRRCGIRKHVGHPYIDEVRGKTHVPLWLKMSLEAAIN